VNSRTNSGNSSNRRPFGTTRLYFEATGVCTQCTIIMMKENKGLVSCELIVTRLDVGPKEISRVRFRESSSFSLFASPPPFDQNWLRLSRLCALSRPQSCHQPPPTPYPSIVVLAFPRSRKNRRPRCASCRRNELGAVPRPPP